MAEKTNKIDLECPSCGGIIDAKTLSWLPRTALGMCPGCGVRVGSDLASIEKADQAGESKVLGVLAPTGQDLKSQAGKYAGYMATKPEPAKKPEAAAPAPSKPAAQPSAGSPAPAKPAAKPEPNPLVEDAKARAEAHQQRIDAESKGQQEFSEIQKRMAALMNATG